MQGQSTEAVITPEELLSVPQILWTTSEKTSCENIKTLLPTNQPEAAKRTAGRKAVDARGRPVAVRRRKKTQTDRKRCASDRKFWLRTRDSARCTVNRKRRVPRSPEAVPAALRTTGSAEYHVTFRFVGIRLPPLHCTLEKPSIDSAETTARLDVSS